MPLSTASLSIPSPCPESWSQMASVTGGRHCASCQKTVQDFSTFSDRDLANWLSTYAGEPTCGRFRADQVEQPIQPLRSEPSGQGGWVRWAVTLMLGWQTANGQSEQPQTDLTILSTSTIMTLPIDKAAISPKSTLNEPAPYGIAGRVIDENSVPIEGVSIIIKGTRQGVVTDKDGNFKLPIAQEVTSTRLMFSYIGYKFQEVTVTSKNRESLLIIMQPSNETLLGEVVVVRYPQGNFLQRTWWSTKRLFGSRPY